MFFADCPLSSFEQSEQTVLVVRDSDEETNFQIHLHLSAIEIGLYSTKEDREVFYHFIDDINKEYPGAALWETLEFQVDVENLEQISTWLERLSSTNGKVRAEYIHRNGENSFRILSGLRIINEYQITQVSDKNTFLVRIKIAAWICRSYNQNLLDLDVMSLSSPSTLFDSKRLIPISIARSE
ncbi:MAG TPA: hypothetical protein PKY59_23520 [Pyrinomonadaceae bacterium]|nr:hypothetical protein [Pyrinomonadaceae bacterium]